MRCMFDEMRLLDVGVEQKSCASFFCAFQLATRILKEATVKEGNIEKRFDCYILSI